MCTALILTPVSRKSVSMSFFTTNNNTVVISNLAPPAWNSITRCKLFNVLSVWWYIKFYDVFFILFCCFIAAQSNAIHLCNAYNIFWTRRPGMSQTLAGHMTRWWRDLHDLFSSKSFHICAKKPQDIWVDRTFSKSKGKSFMEIILSSKYSWKRNRFSIVIVNICETRNEWLIQSYRLMSLIDMDWSDVQRWTNFLSWISYLLAS